MVQKLFGAGSGISLVMACLILAAAGFQSESAALPPSSEPLERARSPSWAIERLNSPSHTTRLAAATTLGQCSPADVADVPKLIGQLRSHDAATRYWSCIALARIGPAAKDATDGLKRLLVDAEPAIRLPAAEAIYQIAPEADLVSSRMAGLLHGSGAGDGRNNRYLVKLLPEMLPWLGKPDLVSKLLRDVIVEDRGKLSIKAEPNDREQRRDRHRAAIEVLGCLGPDARQAVPTLIESMLNSDGSDRTLIGHTLSRIGRPAVVALVERSRAEDDLIKRGWIWSTLGAMGSGVLADLAPYWRDPNPKVRHDLVTAVQFMGPAAAAAIPDLVRALKDPDPSVRVAASVSFSQFGPAAAQAMPALGEAVFDHDSEVVGWALLAITELGPLAKGAVPALAKRLETSPTAGRWNFADALAAIGPNAAKAVPALLRVFDSSDDETRAAILKTIAQTKAESKLNRALLVASLDAPSWKLQLQAALLVERLDPNSQPARKILSSLLATREEKFRSEVLGCLPFYPKHFARFLVRRSNSKEHEPIGLDRDWLMRLGSDAVDVIPDLVQLIRDCDVTGWDNALAAVDVLGSIGEPALPAVEKLASDDDGMTRIWAAQALVKLRRRPLALDVLIANTGHERRQIREQAAGVLSGLAQTDAHAREQVIGLLDRSDPRVRTMAAMALGELKPEIRGHATAALLKALSDPNKEVRFQTAQWLVNLNAIDPQMLPLIVVALRDTDAGIRRQVLEHLQWVAFDVPILAPLVKELTADPDFLASQAAAYCLGRFDLPKFLLAQTALPEASAARRQPAIVHPAKPNGPPAPENPLDPVWEDKRFSQWLENLRSGGGDERAAAAEALHQMFDYDAFRLGRGVGIADAPQVMPVLVQALHDREADVRRASAEAVALCGPYAAPAIDALRQLLQDRRCRLTALNALGALRSTAKAAIPEIRPLLEAENQMLRIAAAEALWMVCRDSQAVHCLGAEFEKLLTASQHDGHASDEMANFLTNEVGADTISLLPMLVKLLHGSEEAASYAARILANIGPPAKVAVPALIELIDRPKPDRQALWALAKIGPDANAAVPVIVRLYHESVKDTGPRPQITFDDRCHLINALGEIAEPRDMVISLCVEALAEPDIWVRSSACRQLAKFGSDSKSAVPALAEMVMGDANGFGAGGSLDACRALGGIGPAAAEAVPALIGFVSKANGDRAVEALGRIGPAAKAAVPILKSKLEDCRFGVPAAVALWRIGERSVALETLEKRAAANDYAAFAGLISLGPDAREVIDWLHRMVESNRLGDAGLDALIQLAPDDPLAIRSLEKRMSSPDIWTSVQAAALLWPARKNAKAREILEVARYRTDPGLRHVAASALATTRSP